MDAENDRIAGKVQYLSDIELALLVCLVADQHCIIETRPELLDAVAKELKLVAKDVFGLTWALLDCNEHTTLDDFGRGILVEDEEHDYFSVRNAREKDEFAAMSESPRFGDRRVSKSPRPFSPLDSRRIGNILIVRNLNRASTQVQTQALELMRGKRNFTRTAVHVAPKPFVLVALSATGISRLITHVTDQFFISHKHREEDGLPNLENSEAKEPIIEDDASTSSVVRTPPSRIGKSKPQAALFSPDDLTELTARMAQVKISSDVRAYLHNIVVFMRLHRAVGGGISALATRHFNTLAHALAPLHGLDYVSPSLVALAARKIYPHRIVITTPENERSMQWGSNLEAVKIVLEGVTEEGVVEDVLESVEAPL